MYAINDRRSMEEVEGFIETIKRVKRLDDGAMLPIVLVGNKCDLGGERQLYKEEGEKMALAFNCAFFEVLLHFFI